MDPQVINNIIPPILLTTARLPCLYMQSFSHKDDKTNYHKGAVAAVVVVVVVVVV